jgi:hypothetical protein
VGIVRGPNGVAAGATIDLAWTLASTGLIDIDGSLSGDINIFSAGSAVNSGAGGVGIEIGDELDGTIYISFFWGTICDVTVVDGTNSTGAMSAGLKNNNATLTKGGSVANVLFTRRFFGGSGLGRWDLIFGFDPEIGSAQGAAALQVAYADIDPLDPAYLDETWTNGLAGQVENPARLDRQQNQFVSIADISFDLQAGASDSVPLLGESNGPSRISDVGTMLWGGYVELDRLDPAYIASRIPDIVNDSVGSGGIDTVFMSV